jgi:hypothetical protein
MFEALLPEQIISLRAGLLYFKLLLPQIVIPAKGGMYPGRKFAMNFHLDGSPPTRG